MGRKPLAKVPKLGRLVVLLTDVERATIDRAAKRAGVPTSTWMRDLALDEAGKTPRTKGVKS